MPTNTKQVDFTKPFQFTVEDNPTVFTCNVPFEDYSLVSWKDEYETYKSTEIHISHCKKYVQDGDWTHLTNENTGNTQQEGAMKKLEDYIKAINKNVPEAAKEGCEWCECPDCKDAFTSVNESCFFCEGNISNCECGEYVNVPEPSMTLEDYPDNLLESIKDFTTRTKASVFINDGSFEVYWAGLDNPFKAVTDDEMWKLIEAVEMLEGSL
jgi:hypothetical protein